MTKQIRNLYAELFEVSGVEADSRFKQWAKQITDVNRDLKDGYAFTGPFINQGTVEVKNEPALFLVAGTFGSRKNQMTEYAVVRMDADGKLSHTGIKTQSYPNGWALRIRDEVADLLQAITAAGPVPGPARFVNLTPHAVNVYASRDAVEYWHIEPSGTVARCAEEVYDMGQLDGVPVRQVIFGAPTGLPAQNPDSDTVYIVSALVFAEVGDARPDVMAPGPAIRNADGVIVGCIGFTAGGAYYRMLKEQEELAE